MQRLYRARGVPAGSALFALSLLVTHLAYSENGTPPREWKAPARAASTRNPVSADDKSLAIGKSLYVKECLACHGDSGKGNGPEAGDLSHPPPDFNAELLRKQSDGEIFWKLTEGRKPMPRFARTFSDDERWNLVNYIRWLAPKLSE